MLKLQYNELYNNYLNYKSHTCKNILLLHSNNINFNTNDFIKSTTYEYNINIDIDIIDKLIYIQKKFDIIIINTFVNLDNIILFLLNINGILILEINNNYNEYNEYLQKNKNNNIYLLYLYNEYDNLQFILIYKFINLLNNKPESIEKYIDIIDYRNYYIKKLNNNYLHIKLINMLTENNLNKHFILLKYIISTDKVLKLGNDNDISFFILNLIIKNNNLVILEDNILNINYINEIKELNNFNFNIETDILNNKTFENLIKKYNIDFNILIIDKIEYLDFILNNKKEFFKNINKFFLLYDYNINFNNYDIELKTFFYNKININNIYILWIK